MHPSIRKPISELHKYVGVPGNSVGDFLAGAVYLTAATAAATGAVRGVLGFINPPDGVRRGQNATHQAMAGVWTGVLAGASLSVVLALLDRYAH